MVHLLKQSVKRLSYPTSATTDVPMRGRKISSVAANHRSQMVWRLRDLSRSISDQVQIRCEGKSTYLRQMVAVQRLHDLAQSFVRIVLRGTHQPSLTGQRATEH